MPQNSTDYAAVVKALPAYMKIYHALRNDILSWKLLPGEKLPSENDLCLRYDVSHHTVRHAFQLLVDEGLILRRQGKASTVRPVVEKDGLPGTVQTLHMGVLNQPELLLTQYQQYFARRVAELTQGRLRVEVHHSSSLGSGAEEVHKVAAGEIAFFGGALDWLSVIDPASGVASFPFLFRDREHLSAFMNHPYLEKLHGHLIRRHNLRVLSANWCRPSRLLISRSPCFGLKEIEGLRIGIPQIPIYRRLWETLGAVPVEVLWGERKKAFQENRIDATDLNWEVILSENLYKEAPFISCINHLYSLAGIVVSEKIFRTLRKDIQEKLALAALEAGENYSRRLMDKFQEDKKIMLAHDMFFIESNFQPLREKAEQLFQEEAPKNNWPVDLYKNIKAL